MLDQILMPLSPGTRLENRYVIRSVLGEGGMSRVYLADAVQLGKSVAIKENLQTDSAARSQFEREARILANLYHPHIPRVADHFIDDQTGRQYLVMDYIEGDNLETVLSRGGPLSEKNTLIWIQQVLSALEYLHSQNPPVIHRDVKPSNIKITPQGNAVLVDFGISKISDPHATLTMSPAGTPGYAPPEQYGMLTSERSDIYSIGATLYTMLTGQIPPAAPLRLSGEELVPPIQIRPGQVSPQVNQVVLRAMALQTTKRWATVKAMQAALRGSRRNGSEKTGPSLAMLIAVLGICFGLLAIGWVTFQAFNSEFSRLPTTNIPTSLPTMPVIVPNPTSTSTTVLATLSPTQTSTLTTTPTQPRTLTLTPSSTLTLTPTQTLPPPRTSTPTPMKAIEGPERENKDKGKELEPRKQ